MLGDSHLFPPPNGPGTELPAARELYQDSRGGRPADPPPNRAAAARCFRRLTERRPVSCSSLLGGEPEYDVAHIDEVAARDREGWRP